MRGFAPVVGRIWGIGFVTLIGLLGTISFAFSEQRSATAAQTIPYKMNFQGRLTDNSGGILADGSYNAQFRIYDAPTGGSLLWSETRETTSRVTVTNGLFSVQLGDVTSLSPSLFNSSTPRYFEITLATPATATCSTASCASWESPMTPRQPLGSAAYAFNADTVDGVDASSIVQLSPGAQQTGSINVSGNIVSGASLQAASAVLGGSTSLTVGTASTNTGSIIFNNATNANTVTLAVGATTSNYQLTLPPALGVAGDCLKDSNGSGVLEFSSCGGAGGGVSTVGTYSTTNTAAGGATIAGNTITFQDASATAPGMVGTGTQTFAGNKTFSGSLTVANSALFQNGTNSTTAFQIQNAAGSALFIADTTNAKLSTASLEATTAATNSQTAILTTIDSAGEVGTFTSLALGSDGFARISYYDSINQDLKFIQCTNADCSTKNTTTVDSTGGVGAFTSLALGSDGFARISYYDATNGDLKFTQCTNASCSTRTTTTVDSTGDIGRNTSLALGSDGFARISYYDFTNQDLKFTQCTNADCTTKNTTTVDSTGSVGSSTSLALGSDGFARISYYDFTNQDLKFTQCTNADCTTKNTTTVDSTGGVGTFTSLALGSDGFARISYSDDTNSDLKFTQCTNADCTTKNTTTVDSTGDIGRNASLALGSDGFARISYYDRTINDLKFTQCTNADCTTKVTSTIDSVGSVGSSTSIALGSDGFARISYYDLTNGDLKFARLLTASGKETITGSSVGSAANNYGQIFAKSIDLQGGLSLNNTGRGTPAITITGGGNYLQGTNSNGDVAVEASDSEFFFRTLSQNTYLRASDEAGLYVANYNDQYIDPSPNGTNTGALEVEKFGTGDGLIVTKGSGEAGFLARFNIDFDQNVFALSNSGQATFQNYTNSTTAFQIQNAAGTTTLLAADTTNNKIVLGASTSLTLTGGTTRPASPTEGMLYYDTTSKQLLVYANGKWQADRSTSTKIVAANNSPQATKDGADFVVSSADEAAGNADAAINAAIAALPSAGGNLYIAEGTYNIDTTITIPSNVTVSGSGASTIIKVKNALNTSLNVLTSSSTSGINITNFVLDGNKTNNTGSQTGISFSIAGSGTGSSSTAGIKINGMIMRNFNGAGLNIGTGSRLIITENEIINNSTAMIFSGGVDYSIVSNNTITGNVSRGIYFTGLNQYTTISNNNISGNTGTGIETANLHDSILSNNKLHNNTSTGTSSSMDISGDRNTITDNEITDTAGTGFAIILRSTYVGNYLSNNKFSGTGASSISDLANRTIYANQIDGSGNTINRGQGGFSVGMTTNSASFDLQGALRNVTLPTPAAPTLTTGGTAGSTTYGYRVTALDGLGETLASTETTIATGNATLTGTNLINITWTQVGGAVQYRIYRTTSAGTPSSTGLIRTVAGNVSTTTDTGIAASGSLPGANTTGSANFAGTIQGGSSATLGSASVQGSIVLNDGSGQTATIRVADIAGNYTYTIPVTAANDTFCLQTLGNCSGGGGSYINNIATLQSGNIYLESAGGISTPNVILQAISGQSANLLQFRNSAGGVMSGISSDGNFFTASALDTYSVGTLSVGTTNATSIALNKNVTVAANQTLTITGGSFANRPVSPVNGMMYFDTTSGELLVYGNGKWQADSSSSTKIVAASNSSQAAKDAADYVADGEDSSGAGIGTLDGDQIQINSALTAAAGGKVYLMEGTYTVDGSISIPNNTILAGAGNGSLVRLGNFGGTTTNINAISNADQVTGTGIVIRDLKVDGRKSLNTLGIHHGIFFDDMGDTTTSQGALVTDISIVNFRNTGISLNSSDNNRINNIASSGSSMGIYLDGSEKNSISQNNLTDNSNSVYLQSSYDNNLTDNVISTGGFGIYLFTSYNNNIANNSIKNSPDGIVLSFGYDNTVTGNTINGGGGIGIYVEDAARDTIVANTITNKLGVGVDIINSESTMIQNNKIHDSGGSSNIGHSIFIEGTSTNTVVDGNYITDTAGLAYAIFVDGATSTTLSGNTFGTASNGVWNASGPVYDIGTGTIFQNQIDGTGKFINKSSGGLTVQATTNSTSAFQVQNASGTSLLTADTASSQILINSANTGQVTVGTANANSLPVTRRLGQLVYANGYVYVIGGMDGSSVAQNSVYYAKMNADGTTGAWTLSANTLPATVVRGSAIYSPANGFIYSVGGTVAGSTSANVYAARINSDGTTSAWAAVTSLPAIRQSLQVEVANGYIYAFGGSNGTTAQNTVYYAKVNPNGTLPGSWSSSANTIPGTARFDSSSVAINSRVYIMGGSTTSGGSGTTAIYHAAFNATTGDISSWTTSPTVLPAGLANGNAFALNGVIYYTGGQTNGTGTDVATIRYTKPAADGSLSAFASSSNVLANTTAESDIITFNGYFLYYRGSAIDRYSTPRVSVGGSLDLVGSTLGSNGVSGAYAGGGNLTAGDTTIVGTFEAMNTATFDGTVLFQDGVTLQNTLTMRPAADSTTLVWFQNAAGVGLFSVDSTNSRVYVGSTTADATGTILVLDTKNTAGDPTGVDGGMYYNSNLKKMRCYVGGVWQDCLTAMTARKTADQSNSTTTIASVTDMAFPVLANTDYDFACTLVYQSAATTTGIKIAWTGPASQTSIAGAFTTQTTTAGALGGSLTRAYDTTVPAAGTTGVDTINVDSVGDFRGIFRNGANAGTLTLRMASEIGGSNVTLKAGSHCRVMPIN